MAFSSSATIVPVFPEQQIRDSNLQADLVRSTKKRKKLQSERDGSLKSDDLVDVFVGYFDFSNSTVARTCGIA